MSAAPGSPVGFSATPRPSIVSPARASIATISLFLEAVRADQAHEVRARKDRLAPQTAGVFGEQRDLLLAAWTDRLHEPPAGR
jgi:hypothetical protein